MIEVVAEEVWMKHFAPGDWVVAEGKEDEFLQWWTEFLEWTKVEAPGFLEAPLLRDDRDARNFVSLSEWSDEGARDAWRSHADFGQHLDAAEPLRRLLELRLRDRHRGEVTA